MREQILRFYGLSTLEDVDFKIRQVGKYWREVKNIEIEYFGGAYGVKMLARGIIENQE